MSVKGDRTTEIAVQFINTLKQFREDSCSLLEIEIERTICEVSSGNHAMYLLLECWKSQSFLTEIATFKFS